MKINAENVLKLAKFIASRKYDFDMNDPYAEPKCGSAGCIGGHASLLWDDVAQPSGNDAYTWSSIALAEKLGISSEQEEELCYADSLQPLPLSSIKRSHAVTFLKALAEHKGKKIFRWVDVYPKLKGKEEEDGT